MSSEVGTVGTLGEHGGNGLFLISKRILRYVPLFPLCYGLSEVASPCDVLEAKRTSTTPLMAGSPRQGGNGGNKPLTSLTYRLSGVPTVFPTVPPVPTSTLYTAITTRNT